MGISTMHELLRRADVRGHGPEQGCGREVLHAGTRHAAWKASASKFEVAEESIRNHQACLPGPACWPGACWTPAASTQWRTRWRGAHVEPGLTIAKLQHSTRTGKFDHLQGIRRSSSTTRASGTVLTLRGLLEFKLDPRLRPCRWKRSNRSRPIMKRFKTPAPCRYGSISTEAHEHAGDGHEPHRRQEQHRRGRRRPGPLPQ